MMNCPNCGAPLKNGKCEYCGTEQGKTVKSSVIITADHIELRCEERK